MAFHRSNSRVDMFGNLVSDLSGIFTMLEHAFSIVSLIDS